MDRSNEAAIFDDPHHIQVSMPGAFDNLPEAIDPSNADYFDLEGPLFLSVDFPWSSVDLGLTGEHLSDYDKHSQDGAQGNTTATETDRASNNRLSPPWLSRTALAYTD